MRTRLYHAEQINAPNPPGLDPPLLRGIDGRIWVAVVTVSDGAGRDEKHGDGDERISLCDALGCVRIPQQAGVGADSITVHITGPNKMYIYFRNALSETSCNMRHTNTSWEAASDRRFSKMAVECCFCGRVQDKFSGQPH